MKNRLTNRAESGFVHCTQCCTNQDKDCAEQNCFWAILDRLAAYEDSGLSPERIRELQNAFNILFESERQKQQENEQLQAKLDEWKYEAKCHMDEVIAREKQIEQLRVRVARMRELLTKAYDEIEKYKCLWKGSKPSGCDCPKPTALQDEIEQTLAEIDKAKGGWMVDIDKITKRIINIIKNDYLIDLDEDEEMGLTSDIVDILQALQGDYVVKGGE